MSLLTLILLVFSKVAVAGPAAGAPWPRLLNALPARACAPLLSGRDQALTELIAFLDLSHPLLRRYLELNTPGSTRPEHAFHVDVRTLALIYGDQPDLSLRRTGARDPLDAWTDALGYWAWRKPAARAALVSRFVGHLADIRWSPDRRIPGSTVYLKDFGIAVAFRSDVQPGWASMAGRHWDVDDREHVASDLHRRVEALRRRLATDPALRAALESRLGARLGADRLPAVTRRLRRFLVGYRRYVREGY